MTDLGRLPATSRAGAFTSGTRPAPASEHGSRLTLLRVWLRDEGASAPPNVLGVSCAAGPACRKPERRGGCRRGDAKHDWRTATAVTPSRWRYCRQLGCRAEAGPHQLHTKVRCPAAHTGVEATDKSLSRRPPTAPPSTCRVNELLGPQVR